MSAKAIIKTNLFILIGGNLSSLLNYLLNLVLLRVDKGLFNEYTIVSSIALILFVPSLVVYRVFGTYGDKIYSLARKKLQDRKFFILSISTFVILFFASLVIVTFLLPNKSYFSATLLMILIVGVIIVNMYRGIRQYKEDFVNYVITLNIEAAARSILGFVLAYYLHWGIDGILIGHILGLIICWAVSYVKIDNFNLLKENENLQLKKVFLNSIILTLGLEFFSNFDILFANSILSTNFSAQTEFNTIQFFRKIIFFSIFIFCGLVLSITGKKDKTSKYTFYYTLTTGIGIGVLLSLGFLFAENLVLKILNQTLDGVTLPFMIIFLLATIFMSAAYLLSNWLYATGRSVYTYLPGIMCFIEILIFVGFGKDFYTLIWSYFFSSTLFFLFAVLVGVRESYFSVNTRETLIADSSF